MKGEACMKKKLAMSLLSSTIILGMSSTPVFATEVEDAASNVVTEDDAHDVESKRIVVDEKRVDKWVIADQNREGYSTPQEGLGIVYNLSGGDTVDVSISLAYGAASVSITRGCAIGDTGTPGVSGYTMDVPADGHKYVLLTKNTIEAKQYGIYERQAGTNLPWELVETYEECEVVSTELRRVDVENLDYYDYI